MKLAVILFVCMFAALANEAFATEHHQEKHQEKHQEHQQAKGGESAGGHEQKGAKQSEFKHVKKSGKTIKHDVEKAKKGESLKEIHKKVNEEGGGKKKKYHSSDGHKSSKHHGGGSAHGAKFQEGKKKKKLSYNKGFRELYHKDEQKKHNSFYSNSHKSGEFEVFGQKHAKYNSKSAAKKQVENHKAGKAQKDYKKVSAKAGGHESGDQKGHKEEKGAKSHHSHHDQWAKKGGKKGGKQYKYSHK